jgi:hypothetical protein
VITKVLLGAAVAFAAAVGVATPAGADPSAFGVLSCSCQEAAADTGAIGTDQTSLGIQNGIADLLAIPDPAPAVG